MTELIYYCSLMALRLLNFLKIEHNYKRARVCYSNKKRYRKAALILEKNEYINVLVESLKEIEFAARMHTLQKFLKRVRIGA